MMKTRKLLVGGITFTFLMALTLIAHAAGPVSWGQQTRGAWEASTFNHTQPHPSALWSLSNQGDYPTLSDVIDHVALDADGDGDMDLAVLGWQERWLLMNDGTGVFTQVEAGDFDERSEWAAALTAFDADGDGDMDLAVVEEHGSLPNRVYLNDGHGRFTRIDAGDFDDPVEVSYQVVALDADGDGDMDLAVGNQGPDRLYLNDGAAHFSRVDSGAFDDCPCPDTLALIAFDADGDGDMDLARGGFGDSQPNALFLNDGQGVFTRGDGGDFGRDPVDTSALAAFDIDGDGDADLVAGKNSLATPETMYDAVYRNDGHGLFQLTEGGDFDNVLRNTSRLAPFDADGDGDLDLAVAYGLGSRPEANALYRNDGQGHFLWWDGSGIDDSEQWTRAVTPFDVDGDGDMDLAFGNARGAQALYINQQNVSTCVTLAREGFTARAAGDFGKGYDGPGALGVTLDVDGDSDMDLISRNAAGRLVLYKNDGSGQLHPADGGALAAILGDISALAALDADGDGDPDLAVADFRGPNRLFFNDGQGGFRLAEAGEFDNMPLKTLALAAFDADGDGDMDLMSGHYHQPAGLYLNDGQGVFHKRNTPDFINTTQRILQQILPFDADHDGDMDVLLIARDPSDEGFARLYLNDGQARFQQKNDSGLDAVKASLPMQARDLNRDGFMDLASPRQVFLNDGQGVFTEVPQNDDFTQSESQKLALFDADGDGDADLLRNNTRMYGLIYETLQLFLNNGAGHFTLSPAGEIDQVIVRGDLLSADMDSDGRMDVIALGWHGQGVYRNQGGGLFARLPNAGGIPSDESATYDLKAADINGDGALDLIAGVDGPNRVYLGDGRGAFRQADAGDLTADDLMTRAVALFDADGDGDIDVAAGHSTRGEGNTSSLNVLYLNQGQGRFTRADAGEFDDLSLETLTLAAFDADGDGDMDLAEGLKDGQNRLWINDGRGRFTRQNAGDFENAASYPQFLLAFDADGDGDQDLLAPAYPDRLYLNDGSGHFSARSWSHRPTYFSYNAIAFDMDQDQDLDLAIMDDEGNVLSFYLNDGAAFFTRTQVMPPVSWMTPQRGLAALDVDGDGDLDLADGTGRVLLNQGDGHFTPETMGDFSATALPRYVMIPLDADGDGDTDLAAGGSGINLIFFNQGLYDQGDVTSPVISPQAQCPGCGSLLAWTSLHGQMQAPPRAQLTFDVLDPTTNQPIPGFENRTLDANQRLDLTGLDPAAHPAIRVRARFADLTPGPDTQDQTPRLCRWTVLYQREGVDVVAYWPLVQR